MADMLIQTESLERSFRRGDSVVHALRKLSVAMGPGELVALSGPSGCGKTTLLHILGLLDGRFLGEVWFCGHRIRSLGAKKRARLRLEKVGFVFQGIHLIPSLSALDNAALPNWRMTGSSVRARGRARTLLEDLGLGERLAHKPERLSGGEAQRVVLARALANDPDLVLADEPTAHLDDDASRQVLDLLACMSTAGKTVVVASHDPLVTRRAGRILHLSYGRILPEPGTVGDALLCCCGSSS